MHPFRTFGAIASFTIVCLLAGTAAGQQRIASEYRFGALGIEDGLSQGMIFCMLQDTRGFLWFGTKEGLNRYDGYSFTVYRNIPGDPNSLPDNQIFSMAEDGHGRIWIGTRTRGLQLFDPVSETFTSFPFSSLRTGRTINESIHHLVVDSGGRLWVGGWRRLLAGIDTRRDTISLLHHGTTVYADDSRFQTGEAFSLSLTGTGRIAILVDDGVWTFHGRMNKFERLLHWRSMGLPIGQQGSEIVTGSADAFGRFWVSARLAGRMALLRIDLRTGTATDTLRFEHDGTELTPRAMTIGPDGMLYCTGTYLFIRCDIERRTYSVSAPMPSQVGRLHGEIVNLRFDRSGNLWLGTSGHGLHTFNPHTLAFHPDTRLLNQVLFGHELRKFEEFVKRSSRDADKRLDLVFPVRAADGSVWCGTANYGLLHHDAASGQVRRYGFSPHDPYSFLMLRFTVPFVDSKNRVWVGNTQGVSMLVDRPEQWEHFFFNEEGPDLTRREDNVNCYHEDRDGTLWLGTISSGLAHLDPADGSYRMFKYDISDTTSISSDHVLCIAADPRRPDRYLWIGTDGGGLNRFDKETRRFRRIGLVHDLPNMVIYGILADSAGMLWMSSNKGIARLDPSTLQFTNYLQRDGLQANEFNRTEYYSIPPRLYFGGVRGHNSFDPAEIRRNLTVPEIVLTGLRLFNNPVTDRSILPVAAPYARLITLAHDQNMLTFEFAALDYSSPSMNRYRYMMEGLDERWIDAGTARSATYTYLRPGEYTFRVIGSNNHGVWNTKGATLRIVVRSPWWQSPWAYASYVLLLVAALFVVDRLQRRRVIARERQRASMREAVLRAEAAELEARAVRAEHERSGEEIRVAAEIQKRIIPRSLPDIPGYAIAGINLPAHEIGGDYYDCIPLGEGRFALVMADVTGKGIPAALLVNSLHASLLLQLDTARVIEDLALRLNDLIYRISTPSTFITFILAILHAPSGTIEMVNAGHNPALVLATDGTVEVMTEHGLPLGCSIEVTQYQRELRVLMPGEGFLLYTDGIPEAMDAELQPFGQEALEEFLASQAGNSDPSATMGALVERIERHRGEAAQSDDLTMLFIRRTRTTSP